MAAGRPTLAPDPSALVRSGQHLRVWAREGERGRTGGGGGVEEKRDLKEQINGWMVEGEELGVDTVRFPRNMNEAWLQKS